MLKKFIAIKNVGKFRNYGATGDIEFRKLNLIYAENGRGKTTLSAILRSLESGDPLFISERRTVDGNGDPHIDVLSVSGKLTFAGNAWTAHYGNLVVFDSTYVTENVYSGDSVEHDHKKRLYQVSIGKQGVELAKKVTDLDAKSRELASKLTASAKILSKNYPDGMTLEQFLALAKDDGIDDKIAKQKKSIEALADAEAIKTRGAFTKLSMPASPPGLEALLAKVLETVSRDAEDKILKHIEQHSMGREGHDWISRGLPYVHNGTCPFCGLSVSNNDLLQAYRSYFSEAYENFKKEIKTFDTDYSGAFSDKKMATLNTTFVQNQANLEFWKKYAAVSLLEISFDEKIVSVIQKVVDTVAPLIRRKMAAPLEPITLSPEAQRATASLAGVKTLIDEYNNLVEAANPAVAAVKKGVETGNAIALRNELARLEAQKKRHSEALSTPCTEYLATQKEKEQTETEKGKTKKQLDEYTEAVLQKYEQGINKLLDRFGAGFRLTGTKQQYLGGSPSSTFKLSINGVPIELGDSKTPRGTTCFRNTISAGDKNTLALAFFLVQLQQRADLNTLTVVFDDPLTSLDRFRQQFTRDQIRAVEKKANQVIVLSHEPAFLQLIAEDFDAANLRVLYLARDGIRDTTIKPWDMKAELAPGYHQDVATMTAYYYGDAKDLRAVIRCIRPVMEGHLRTSHHGQFAEKEWLGDMIAKIRNSTAGHPLESVKSILSDLESLNDYTKRYHHDNNDVKANPSQPQDGELQSFVKLTLQLTNRL